MHTRITSVALISAAVATISGCGVVPTPTGGQPLTALLQDAKVLGASSSNFIFENSEAAQCPPTSGLLQPAECRTLDPSRRFRRSLYLLNADTLAKTPIETEIPEGTTAQSDGRRIAWIDRDAGTLNIFDTQSGTLSSYPLQTADFVLKINGDYVACHSGNDATEHKLIIYSITDETIVAERDYRGVVAALAGDWLAYLAANESDRTEEYPDVVDVMLLNLSTGEERVVADDVSNGRYGPSLLMSNGTLVWTQFTSTSGVMATEYEVETGDSTIVFDRPNNGVNAAIPTAVHDISDAGMLVYQAGADQVGNARYELVSWSGEVTTLYTLQNDENQPDWYRSDDLRFAGNQALWTDPASGVFMIHNIDTGETGEVDPYVR